MKSSELQHPYYMFGNKGACWGNGVHIAKVGFSSTTLCGTPMLSTNWARIWEHEEIGCPECLMKYNIRETIEAVMDGVFQDMHAEYNTVSGDISPEQSAMLDELYNKLAEVMYTQVKQNLPENETT